MCKNDAGRDGAWCRGRAAAPLVLHIADQSLIPKSGPFAASPPPYTLCLFPVLSVANKNH